MEYKNLNQILHIELDKKIGNILVDEMITHFDVEESFQKFLKVYETLQFANDVEKREYIKTTLKTMFGNLFRSYKGSHHQEACEFVSTVCKIYIEYIMFFL